MRLPDFLIIGAQKCGTTWLHHHLRRHPRLYLPAEKELSRFCWTVDESTRPLDDYAEHFRDAGADQRVGEATAAYFWTGTGSEWEDKPPLYDSQIPERVGDELGADTRLILALRDPAERAVSAYFHHLAFGAVDPSQPLLQTRLSLGIVDIGFYGRHLQNWLRVFPREQLLMLDLLTDIGRDPEGSLRRVHGFLDVAPAAPETDASHKIFAGTVRAFEPAGVRSRDGGFVGAEDIHRLREIYREDVHLLSELGKRDFATLWGYS